MVRSPSEPGSGSESDHAPNTAKTPATKDKACQYCHQKFTSSSLGRHLDQFIFKKKPDGIHNVDEIRALRGGITRRTARSNKKEATDEPTPPRVVTPLPPPQPEPHQTRDLINDINNPPGGVSVRLNRIYWQSTGVITDPAVLNQTTASPPPSFATDLNPTSVADNARALELALRETFPSLCLLLLPTPPTLLQAAPFATYGSCPISPPGPDQLTAVRTKISTTIDHWKWDALRLAQPTATNIADEADFLSRQAASWTETSLKHLDTSYQNWISHPPDARALLWNTELLRAFQSQKDRVSAMEEEINRLQQEAGQLQQQVEYLSQCQWPREMALWPPERHSYSKKMREELRLVNPLKPPSRAEGESESASGGGGGSGEDVHTQLDKWDFDKLVNKWKAHVREDRGRRTMASSTHTPSGQAQSFIPPLPPSSLPGNGVSPAQDNSLPPSVKRVKANGDPGGSGTEDDRTLQQHGEYPVNGIVTIDRDGKEQGERRAPRRNVTKSISFVSDL
ncbi:hypothetical protein DV735_g2189, partial [Chaetothyriales sp. CBS 134920]